MDGPRAKILCLLLLRLHFGLLPGCYILMTPATEHVSARYLRNRKGKENKGSRWMFCFLRNGHPATGIQRKGKERKFPPFQTLFRLRFLHFFVPLIFLQNSYNPNRALTSIKRGHVPLHTYC